MLQVVFFGGTLFGVPIIKIKIFGVYIGVPSFWETTILFTA